MMAARLSPRHRAKCDPRAIALASIALLTVLASCLFLIVTLGSLVAPALSSVRPAPSEEDKPTQYS